MKTLRVIEERTAFFSGIRKVKSVNHNRENSDSIYQISQGFEI